MFAPGVMVIKMSKMVHLLFFLLMPANHQSQFGENIYMSERSYLALSKNTMDCWILSYH